MRPFRHNILVACGVTDHNHIGLAQPRLIDARLVVTGFIPPIPDQMQPQLQGNKASISHDQANIPTTETCHIGMAEMSLLTSPAQHASIRGKTRSKLAHALMSSTESGHRLLWYSRGL